MVVLPPQEEDPKIPYPQRSRKSKLDSQFSKFLEVFKKLHINIQFVDALEQMSSYVKFMKGILAKKRKLGEYEIAILLRRVLCHLVKEIAAQA